MLNKNKYPGSVNTHSGGRSRILGLAKFLAGMLFSAWLLIPAQATAYSLTLAWNASPSPDIAGYQVYYGTASGNYTNSLTVGNVTTATVSGLAAGVTYYFAVSATTAIGLASTLSNPASYSEAMSAAQMQIQALSGGQIRLNGTGTAGQTYNIQASQDLQTWTVVGTVTADASGSLTFTDANAANFPQRFYRTQN